ncbi:hypothetical protein SEVIR_8G071300v4 [Setaria viridis]|uniref:Uncharacterized protein n=1 Tax=Setaria viridis TaxID=4556 RepID=A0A4U6TGF3_SETVI|nr:uncharacterized protein LOC117866510 [Setaria viridis]TKV99852.1 hypothetical protein SEVIR_8G071300v2 [Setaria viridis]
MQRRGEFSFPGSPARGLLPPRPPAGSATAPRKAEEEEVRWLQASRQASPDYSSGTPSPQLWAYHHNPDHHHRLYPASAGSSPSRAQAIAGYRREMLDLVRGLPESAYELSLRDIVEHPAASSSSPSPPTPPDPLPQPSNAAAARHHHTDATAAARHHHTDATAAAVQVSDEPAVAAAAIEDGKKQGRKQRTMRKQRSRSLERSVSLDTGLLIKLFLPLSMGRKKKVSPRPDAAKDSKKKKKNQGKKEAAPAQAQEEEWWNKSEFSEAGSSSRTSSTGSSHSSTGSIRNGHVNGSVNPRAPARSWSRKRTGCYAFFRANKSKNGVSQD